MSRCRSALALRRIIRASDGRQGRLELVELVVGEVCKRVREFFGLLRQQRGDDPHIGGRVLGPGSAKGLDSVCFPVLGQVREEGLGELVARAFRAAAEVAQ
jgi:hypothetical protein